MNDPLHNHPARIDDVYMFVTTDAQGNEGIPTYLSDGIFYPLVAGDPARLVLIQEKAEIIASLSGQTLCLYKFSSRELLDTVTPPQHA